MMLNEEMNIDNLHEKVEDMLDLRATAIHTKNKNILRLDECKTHCENEIMAEKRFLYALQNYADLTFDPQEENV
jgi:hypothetical protein